MPHHGSEPMDDPQFLEMFRKQLEREGEKIGPTGDFPRGKMHPTDEGGLKFAVVADPRQRKILLDFGKPVAWIGLDPGDAVKIAETLLKRAAELTAEEETK